MAAISKKDVRDALDYTNISGQGFPWMYAGVPVKGTLKRWYQLPIKVDTRPLYDLGTHTKPSGIADLALDEVERRLGRKIFERASIVDEVGILFSYGTSAGAPGGLPQHNCGSVSGAPNQTGYPSRFLKGSEISAQLVINLGSPDSPGCIATQEHAIHELGHALGLGRDFEGFGRGLIISDLFWCVLKTLYANTDADLQSNNLKIITDPN